MVLGLGLEEFRLGMVEEESHSVVNYGTEHNLSMNIVVCYCQWEGMLNTQANINHFMGLDAYL